MKLLLLKAPELKLLTDAVRPACAAVVARVERSCSAGEFQTAARMPVCTIEAVLVQAETVTLVLEEILRIRPPSHWSINE